MTKHILSAIACITLVVTTNVWAQENMAVEKPVMHTQTAAPLPVTEAYMARRSRTTGTFHPDLKISRSAKDSLCWQVRLSSKQERATVAEIIHSPGQIFFGGAGIIAIHNGKRTQYTITSLPQPDEAGNIMRCWTFEANDPLGDYQFQLEINQQPVMSKSFHLVP